MLTGFQPRNMLRSSCSITAVGKGGPRGQRYLCRSAAPCLSSQQQQRLASTFAHQSKLPRLPIPPLSNIKQKYLNSCRPLFPAAQDMERITANVDRFLAVQAPVLQERLTAYDKEQKNSWLENLWLQKAYHEYREPSMINVNWWGQFRDDPKHNTLLLKKPPPPGVLTDFQIKRAAGLVSHLIDFKELLDKEVLPPDMIRDVPLCMNQYRNQFGTTRHPGKTCDYLTHQPPPCSSKHIIVMVNDQFYQVQVIRDDGSRVSTKEIMNAFYACGAENLSNTHQPAVGLLTAGHRDNWYKAYESLIALDASNKQNFDIISNALFVVCLDTFSTKQNKDLSHHQIFHGMTGHNRYFDKAMQLIVASSGMAGMNGEHSPADAVIPGRIIDYIITKESVDKPESVNNASLPPPIPPRHLKWVVDNSVHGCIKAASDTSAALIRDTESCLLQTDIYGSRFIKDVAATSPDAYIQLALQLTWCRLYGPDAPTAVYESASTRAFAHGRTETGRSLTPETWAFVKSFDNDEVLYDVKRELFKKAISSQTQYMRDCAAGKGIDRHLMGLYCMATPEERSSSPLFTDPSYAATTNFRLSTSNMSPGVNFWGGFGPVAKDGYGINYAIGRDDLKFSISSKRSCGETSSFEFRLALEKVLRDMFILFPKRSEVWGIGWEKRFAQEAKEERALATMRKLSDKYIASKTGKSGSDK